MINLTPTQRKYFNSLRKCCLKNKTFKGMTEYSNKKLSEIWGISIRNVQTNIEKLKEAGVIQTRKVGRYRQITLSQYTVIDEGSTSDQSVIHEGSMSDQSMIHDIFPGSSESGPTPCPSITTIINNSSIQNSKLNTQNSNNNLNNNIYNPPPNNNIYNYPPPLKSRNTGFRDCYDNIELSFEKIPREFDFEACLREYGLAKNRNNRKAFSEVWTQLYYEEKLPELDFLIKKIRGYLESLDPRESDKYKQSVQNWFKRERWRDDFLPWIETASKAEQAEFAFENMPFDPTWLG